MRFATNNSTVARDGYVARLASMGIAATADEIVTSTTATIEHLRSHAPDVRRVMGVGAPGMEEELRDAGFDVVMAGTLAASTTSGAPIDGFDAVIVGLDPALDYGRLAVAMAAVAGGARFIATNADARYPTPAGFAPGAGATVARARDGDRRRARRHRQAGAGDVSRHHRVEWHPGRGVRGRRRQSRRGRGGRAPGGMRGDSRC